MAPLLLILLGRYFGFRHSLSRSRMLKSSDNVTEDSFDAVTGSSRPHSLSDIVTEGDGVFSMLVTGFVA